MRYLGAAALVLGAAAAAAGLVVLWQPRFLLVELAERSPDVLYFVETTVPAVALTIDDGPDPATTPEILSALARHDARATFFLIGERAAAHEPVVARLVADGHEIGNHMARDRTSVGLTPPEFEAALVRTDRVLSRFARLRWFRPGGGRYTDRMVAIAERHGYRTALGSIYPYDTEIPWSGFAVRHILRKARPGAVIVLHDGGARGRRTARTLRRVLPELARRGLDVVTLSELVESAERTRERHRRPPGPGD